MESWQEQRSRAVAHHGAEQERRRAREVAEATALVTAFAEAARAKGIPDEPLRARSYGGRVYRTALRGWYVHPNRSLAVGVDGRFYHLLVPSSARAWLTGATVPPQDPRLIVGEGARDGESIPLATLLQRRIDDADR